MAQNDKSRPEGRLRHNTYAHSTFVAVLEALEDGDEAYAKAILRSALAEPEPVSIAGPRCVDCGITFQFPGQAHDHARNLDHRVAA